MGVKTISTRFNTPGAIRINTGGNKKGLDKFAQKQNVRVVCTYESDPVTSYVRIKIWDVNLQTFLYPPYVECEYVE